MRKRVGFPCITLIMFTLAQCCVAFCLRAQTTNSEWQFVGPQSLQPYEVSGAAYGMGRWVATTLGWVTTLENGATNWSYPAAVTTSADEGWSRMAFLGGKFLWWGVGEINSFNPLGSVTSVPKMLASDDGLSWTAAQGVTSFNNEAFDVFTQNGFVESAAYGNGAYVAVGWQGISPQFSTQSEPVSGAIWYSPDAYTWTRIYRTTGAFLHAVTFGNGLFTAVGDTGTVVTSTDGLNWAEVQLTNTTQNLVGVAYGPNGWIVTKQGSIGEGLSSADGTNWFLFTAPGLPNEPFYYSFYADGKYWFTAYGDSWTTVDGTSWSRVSAGPSGPTPLFSVRRAPDGVTPRYLAGYNYGAIYSSDDGTNWTIMSSDANGVDSLWPNNQTLAVNSGNCLISGPSCGPAFWRWNSPVDVLVTSNIWNPSVAAPSTWFAGPGLHWSHVSPGGFPIVFGDYLPLGNAMLVAGVNNFGDGSIPLNVAQFTTPNQDAPLYALDYSWRQDFFGTYEGVWMAGWSYCYASLATTPTGFDLYAEAGHNSSGVSWGHFWSPDGTNWMRHTNGLNDPTNFPGIRGLAWGAGQYVAVGTGSTPGVASGPNRIYTSTDGESYAPVDLSGLSPSLGGGEGLTSVAFAGGAFVAVGDEGTILYSTDGLSWTNVRTTDGLGWNRVRYLNNQFWVVGQAGQVASSPDGRAWTTKSTGVPNELNDIGSVNGYYMIVGNNAMVLQSTFSAGSGLTNQPPVASSIPDQSGTNGTPFSYAFPTNTFTDPDAGETISYVASGMPPGISFNAATLTFSGTPTAVGSYQVSVTATDSGSPPLSASTTFNFTVSPAPLTIAADNQTNVYGAPLPTFTASATGLVNGDTLRSLRGTLAFTTAAVASSPVGAYSLVPSGLSSPNYTITFTAGTLNIVPAALTITPDNQTKAYGAALPALTATYSGFVSGDTASNLTTLPDANYYPNGQQRSRALSDQR